MWPSPGCGEPLDRQPPARRLRVGVVLRVTVHRVELGQHGDVGAELRGHLEVANQPGGPGVEHPELPACASNRPWNGAFSQGTHAHGSGG